MLLCLGDGDDQAQQHSQVKTGAIGCHSQVKTGDSLREKATTKPADREDATISKPGLHDHTVSTTYDPLDEAFEKQYAQLNRAPANDPLDAAFEKHYAEIDGASNNEPRNRDLVHAGMTSTRQQGEHTSTTMRRERSDFNRAGLAVSDVNHRTQNGQNISYTHLVFVPFLFILYSVLTASLFRVDAPLYNVDYPLFPADCLLPIHCLFTSLQTLPILSLFTPYSPPYSG